MGRKLTFTVAVAVIVAGAVLLAGCGSSKPSYCSSLTSLEQSVKAIPATDLVKNGTSALKTNVDKVVSNAHAVVNAAKKDFPTETGAIKTAIDSLQTTVNQLEKGASPTLVVQTAGNVASLATSVKNFSSAASSKCK